jgi:hypothetical protein
MLNQFSKSIIICALSIISNMNSYSFAQAELRQNEPLVLDVETGRNVSIRGYARGSVALFKTIGDRDVNQRRCMGYGSIVPDHVIELQEKAAQLTLHVSSREEDTTLILEDPKGQLYCVDDSVDGKKGAVFTFNNMPKGRYRIWVGAFEPGRGFRYTLNVLVN